MRNNSAPRPPPLDLNIQVWMMPMSWPSTAWDYSAASILSAQISESSPRQKCAFVDSCSSHLCRNTSLRGTPSLPSGICTSWCCNRPRWMACSHTQFCFLTSLSSGGPPFAPGMSRCVPSPLCDSNIEPSYHSAYLSPYNSCFLTFSGILSGPSEFLF